MKLTLRRDKVPYISFGARCHTVPASILLGTILRELISAVARLLIGKDCSISLPGYTKSIYFMKYSKDLSSTSLASLDDPKHYYGAYSA
jgi:hypothetical protein